MKRLKQVMVTGLALGLSTAALAGDPHAVSVSFTVKPFSSKADFQTTVTVDYPQGATLDMVDAALHSASQLNAMSSIVTKVEITNPDAKGYYVVKTRGTTEVMGVSVHKWTHSKCKTDRTADSVIQNCSMVLSGGDTREFFDNGGSRSTCRKNGSRVRCYHQGWGRVKEVSKFGITIRTAPRLAIGGAAQLIEDFSTLALILDGNSSPSWTVRTLDAWDLKTRLYTEGRAYIENDHLGSGKSMVITGSNGGSFKLGEQ